MKFFLANLVLNFFRVFKRNSWVLVVSGKKLKPTKKVLWFERIRERKLGFGKRVFGNMKFKFLFSEFKFFRDPINLFGALAESNGRFQHKFSFKIHIIAGDFPGSDWISFG